MNVGDEPRCKQLIHETNREVGVNCGGCAKLAGFRADKQAGYCLVFRRMQGTWHQVQCNRFERKE